MQIDYEIYHKVVKNLKKLYKTDEDFELSSFEISNRLEPVVKTMFDAAIDNIAQEFLYFIDDCESPIEQMLGVALQKVSRSWEIFADNGDYFISTQKVIQCGEQNYRVDFLLTAMRNGKAHNVIIECDGHEFHEKTKAQAARDKKRDRELTKAGYKVIRFTGSEIYNEPFTCAREANQILFS